MAYVNVTVVNPKGEEYDAEVDENTDTPSLLSNLVEMLDLPRKTADGRIIEYRVSLIGAVRIQRGVTIKIEQIGPSPVLNLRPRG